MTNHYALITSLLLDAWFIDGAFAELMLPGVIEMIEGKTKDLNLQTHEKQTPSLLTVDNTVIALGSGDSGSSFSDAPSGSTAIIPVRGAITKYGGLCSHGVQSYMQWTADAEQSKAVSDIVFLIDSPGGQANSSFMFAQQIRNLSKPTVAYVDSGMATSAAYLIASAANKVWVNTPVDMIGSIGAMFSFMDYAPKYEGTKVYEIYSRLSSEKNLAFRRLKENNDDSLLKDMLDENVKHFREAVESHREGRLNLSEADPFKGATYTAAKALKMGLIDGIGPLPQALASLRSPKKTQVSIPAAPELTAEQTPTETINTHTEMTLRQLISKYFAENPDETSEAPATPEASATPETPATPEAATVPTMEERLAALESTLATVTAENTRLKSNTPAAAATAVQVAKETVPAPVAVTAETTSFFSETDEMVAKMKAGIPL